MLSDFAAGIGFAACNHGSVSTYNGMNARSVVDVTFARLQTGVAVQNWRVLADINNESDHRYICYTIAAERVVYCRPVLDKGG